MALVAYFNLELDQMDVKTPFSEWTTFYRSLYAQLEGFDVGGKEQWYANWKSLYMVLNKPLVNILKN